MNLETLQIELRPRDHWEALDLGILMARRWYWQLLLGWCVVAVPVVVLVAVVLRGSPFLAILLLWWLKPAYERVPLGFISAAVFGESPRLREVLRNNAVGLRSGLLAALTIRRFTPQRSFEAPVWALEGNTRDQRRRRLLVLQQRAGSAAFWLTILGIHVEMFLVMGLLTAIYLFVPKEFEIDLWTLALSGGSLSQSWWLNATTLVVMGLVAPVYVASGFALYLNRRVELEAWDIELGFRRLARRLTGVSAAVGMALMVAVSLGFSPATVQAAEPDTSTVRPEFEPNLDEGLEALSPRRRESRELIGEVLAGEDFNQLSSFRYPLFLKEMFEQSDASQPAADVGTLKMLSRVLAVVVEVALWATLIIAILWVARKAATYIPGLERRPRRRRPPDTIVGLPVTADSLPDDVVQQASREWRQGAGRAAMSLLYRAALHALVVQHDCEFRVSDTEGDCLKRTQGRLSDQGRDFFRELTAAWQRLAYAHLTPDDPSFERLLAGWAATFRPPDRQPDS